MPDDYALYLRRSNGRKPLPRQRQITTAHVEHLGGLVVAEFADADRTAFRKIDGDQPKRDGFARMLAMLRATPGLGVAAWHADRLTRNEEDTTELIRVCATGGHLVVTPRGGTYDLSTATGRKRLRDDASDAIYEVDHGRERVLAGRAEVAQEGRWLGGKRPFGWELDRSPLDDDGGPLVDDDGFPVRGILKLREPEAAALAAAHDAILAGASLAAITREWNARGILTPYGKPWRPSELGRILRRPRNAGLMEHQGRIVGAANWPPIVDATTWRGVVAVLNSPERRTTPGPTPKHLLSWIARCGVCTGPVVCTSTSRAAARGRERRLVYRCRDGDTGHLARDAELLEELVRGLVVGRLSREDMRPVLVRPAGGAGLAALRREKAAIEALIAERNQLHVDGEITTAELVGGRQQLRARLEGVKQKIADISQADILAPMLADPAGAWEGMSLDQRRAVIRRMMAITVMPSRRGRPPGWRPGQPYFDRESVRIEWRI